MNDLMTDLVRQLQATSETAGEAPHQTVTGEVPQAPDAPHHLKSPDLIFAGNARFTVRSRTTGIRFTYRVRLAPENPRYALKFFVAVLSGPDNENDYQYLGYVRDDRRSFVLSRKTAVDAPSVQAFIWLMRLIASDKFQVALRQAEIFHEGRCCRCGRTLTVPESIESGIGPECAKRV